MPDPTDVLRHMVQDATTKALTPKPPEPRPYTTPGMQDYVQGPDGAPMRADGLGAPGYHDRMVENAEPGPLMPPDQVGQFSATPVGGKQGPRIGSMADEGPWRSFAGEGIDSDSVEVPGVHPVPRYGGPEVGDITLDSIDFPNTTQRQLASQRGVHQRMNMKGAYKSRDMAEEEIRKDLYSGDRRDSTDKHGKFPNNRYLDGLHKWENADNARKAAEADPLHAEIDQWHIDQAIATGPHMPDPVGTAPDGRPIYHDPDSGMFYVIGPDGMEPIRGGLSGAKFHGRTRRGDR